MKLNKNFQQGVIAAISILFISCGIVACAEGKFYKKKLLTGELSLPHAAVATAHPLATKAALDILEQGGNAFDAAVAASAMLAVVEPAGSGMGGGGFWLLHRQSDGKQVMLDGREMAPGNAHVDMYLDQNRQVIKGASLNGPLAAGIPGQAAALVHLSKEYGNLPLATSLQAAIKVAEEGFAVSPRMKRYLNFRSAFFNDEAKRLFLDQGQVPVLGYIIKQVDLANTLKLLAEKGRQGFYQGEVAQKMLASVRANGGIWTEQDLKSYKVVEREPVVFEYKGARIVSAPPPSSGGIVLGQILQTIELKNEQQNSLSTSSIPSMHITIEAMRRAYRDRSLYLGDSDFVHIDQDKLLSRDYLQTFAKEIEIMASQSEALSIESNQGVDTSHFSIIDHQGNRVAATLSINYPFGSGHIAEGTGVFLNNEMDDFVSKAGEPNVYGLVGGKANQIASKKRPLSSMSPTFIETQNEVIVIGTPGGSRIISMVALAAINILDKGLDLQSAIDQPRYHHQYLPDVVQIEKEGQYDELSTIKEKGHKIKQLNRQYGDMHAASWKKEKGEFTLWAASDSRGEGESIVR